MKKTSFYFVIGSLIILITSCGSGNKKLNANANLSDTTNNSVEISFPKDSTHDQIAGLLSGTGAFSFGDNFTESDYWKSYQQNIDTPWNRITETRLNHIYDWSDSVVKKEINDTALLFYPFSGPDFLHAYQLFPNANQYIFVAMEKIGTIPDLYSLTNEKLTDYLEAVNFALRDIYKRSYFITGNMEQDLRKEHVNGVLPVFYVFLHKTEHEIYDMGYYNLNADGTFTEIDSPSNTLEKIECIRFWIRKKGDNKIKTLTYFYADISDSGFDSNPILRDYLQAMRPCNTFIKSASYLSHYGTFSQIRDIVLEHSNAVLEDDTGVPFRYFSPDSWTAHLFGVYVKPIADFPSTYLYQQDLATAYDTSSVGILPFSLGYHWRTGEQNWMLYVKNPIE
jgi:hypothetical protein